MLSRPMLRELQSQWGTMLDVSVVGQEAYIHWNGPPVHLADSIGVSSLDSFFAGRSGWRFVTRQNRFQSVVISRLKSEKAKSTVSCSCLTDNFQYKSV